MLQAECPPHVSACHLSPLHGTQHGTQRGIPTPLNTRDKQSQQNTNRSYATELHTNHASLLKAMGTLYQTQSLGCEISTYQAHSQGCEKLLPLVAQIPG